ncbi:MAG: hypothetical protein ACE5I3_11830 [Phycisphaerae bacterium]
MREALTRVKRELGDNAVIVGTRSCPRTGIGGLLGGSAVEITAAPPDTALTAPRRVDAMRQRTSRRTLPEHVYPYYLELVQNEVAEELASRLARRAATLVPGGAAPSAGAIQSVLRQTIAKMIPVTGGISLTGHKPRRVAAVGPAGGGKTTTLAKLAAHFRLRLKKRVAMVSLDMQRLGCNDQMRRYAQIIGVPMRTAQTVAAVKSVFRELGAVDLVLIDTHGVCAGDRAHFARLAAVLRAARPDELHLVLPASMVPSVQMRMAQRFAELGVSQVVLTHLDEAVGLGVILNAIEKLEWGLSYVTNGESVPNHIEEACAERMAALIFPPE